MLQPFGQAQHFSDDLETVRVKSIAVNVLGDGDISAGVQRRQKVKSLEDKADLESPQLGSLGVAHGGQIVSVHQDAAPGSLRQAPEHIQQRRLPAAGRTHHADEFSGQNLEIHAPQCRNFHLAGVVELP